MILSRHKSHIALYLTLRPELAVIGLAVIAVLGVLNVCSIDWDIAA